MSIKSKLHKLGLISFYNTARVNIHYFGMRGDLAPDLLFQKTLS